MPRTDTETSIQILAMIARGDTYKEISEKFGVAVSTISDIKQRNQSALAVMQNKMIEHETSKSKKILDKAHTLIEKKLDKALLADQQREELLDQYHEGEIDNKELDARIRLITEPTLTEINMVAREAFHQSQIEQGKPTSIGTPSETKDQLMALVEAIKAGDEVQLFKMVLNPNHNDNVIEGETINEDDEPEPI